MSCPSGQIEMAQSIQSGAILKRQLVCCYEEFSADFEMNRLIKSTPLLLLRHDIGKERKKVIGALPMYGFDCRSSCQFMPAQVQY